MLYLLVLLQSLHGHLELPFFLAFLHDGRLVLLLVSHGDHGQDEVDQVERAQEDDHHEKHHVGLPRGAQRLQAEAGSGLFSPPLSQYGGGGSKWSLNGLQGHQSYLVIEIFPAVLGHEAEQGQEGPAKGVKARVAVVGVATRLETFKPVWTLPVTGEQTSHPRREHAWSGRTPLRAVIQEESHIRQWASSRNNLPFSCLWFLISARR